MKHELRLQSLVLLGIAWTFAALGDPMLTVNGLNADYTTTHVFVDEPAGDSIPLTLLFSPNTTGVVTAEIFSNLNRRDRATRDANGDGIEDGILPPDGSGIVAGDDSNYYKAYTMSPSGTPGQYTLTLNAQLTGAYRLTARYKVSGNPNWFWYTGNGRRDHALVVSPKKARNILLYELNAMNIDSQGTQDYQRSTFTDLYGGPGSRPHDPVTARFDLAYAQSLGINWLWFQPIHPIGIDGRQTDPNTGQRYEVGSPYSVKNFFQVDPLLGKANTRAAALMEFTGFVAAADAAGLNVMLDAAFNHSAWDCELDASGVYYFTPLGNPGNWQPTDEIRNREARFYSLAGAYCSRAWDFNSIAAAPDRGDFGKWQDVHDIFFGRYAALVCTNPNDNGNYLNEGDWLDSTTATGNFDVITRNVWRYFSDYVLYWLDKTGCTAGTPATQTFRGIDGLRADFGQGLPPQCWEYIINKTRSRKWDFVFMSESLDGGAVTYRSNRHFDILNENIVFPLRAAASATDYRNIFEARRSSYGQSLVLLNNTSHDEENNADPYQALIRYSVCATIDGAPMIFYGQELGISRTFGFDRYELNFGKMIPNFKTYNSLQPIFSPANRNFALDQLFPVYAAINQARGFSIALRSSNRYFLDQTGAGGPQPNIFSVGKYEQANTTPDVSDVVFAFANLDRDHPQQGNFNVNISQNGANLFGIKPGRLYNVKNIAAYTALDPNRRNVWLIPGGVSGENLLNNGLFVALNPVPTTDAGWSNAPFEAQYLKLYDVTPPPAPIAPATPNR
jgi:glycosidase